MKFGAHMPTSGGVWKALQRGVGTGCEVIQLFVKNNMQWLGKPFGPEEVRLFARERAAAKLESVFGHAGYLINLGGPPGPNRDKSMASLIQELELAEQLGLPFLVLHPGAHLGKGEAAGLRQVVRGLDQVLQATRRSPVRIALENTAGQGTCLGHRLEQLALILDGVKRPERLGICLDTAHFLAAGYDIRTRRGWEGTMGEVAGCLGLDRVLVMHLNDSKTALGSRVDRHAGIGQGHIGLEAFGHIVNDGRWRRLPGCLETPKSADLHEDVENLRVLRSLVGARGGRGVRGKERRRKHCACGGKRA